MSAWLATPIGAMTAWAAAVGVAECLLLLNPLGGVILHAFIVAALVGRDPRFHTPWSGAMALPSILRISSLAVPWPTVPTAAWYPALAVPILLAAWSAMRTSGLSPRVLGLGDTTATHQIVIAISGLPLGLAIRAIIGDNASFAVSDMSSLVLLLVVAVSVAVPEEFVFRGVLQGVLTAAAGTTGVVITGLVYGTMYLGTTSPGAVALMTGVGLLFGFAVHRTKSIIGTSAAHTLMLICASISLAPVR